MAPAELSLIMTRIRDGDRVAYGILLNQYWAPLLEYAQRYVSPRDSAEDVVQETFIQVWRRRADWTQTGSVSSFLFRVTRNLAMNSRRDRKAELARRERGAGEIVSSMSRSDPHADLAAERLREEVEAAISVLPERRREVFILSRFHHLSHKEIAEAMGIAPQTVANHMRVALAELRASLARHLDGDP